MGFAIGGFACPPNEEDRACVRQILDGEGDHLLPTTDDSHVGEDVD